MRPIGSEENRYLFSDFTVLGLRLLTDTKLLYNENSEPYKDVSCVINPAHRSKAQTHECADFSVTITITNENRAPQHRLQRIQ